MSRPDTIHRGEYAYGASLKTSEARRIREAAARREQIRAELAAIAERKAALRDELRQLTNRALASDLGVSAMTVYRVATHASWVHVR